jgi:O-Glycosyl hydrolase family 30/Glycosyl hydrolase family 30 beta sandwich domain
VSDELVGKNLKTQIVAGEAAQIDYLYKTAGKNDGRDNQMESFFAPASPLYIGNLPNVAPIISSHSYFTVWPLSLQIEMRKALAEKMNVVNPKIGYWQSEYCILEKNDEIGQGSKRDLGMPTALFVARIIHNDLTICNARSWQWWTAITESDYKDGLVYLDSGTPEKPGEMGDNLESLKFNGTARDCKLMWALGNYSRFVRPGMQRIKAGLTGDNAINENLMVSAFINRDNNETVIVLVNTRNEEISVGIPDNKGKTSMYLTSADKNLAYSEVTLNRVLLPARSVATICFTM